MVLRLPPGHSHRPGPTRHPRLVIVPAAIDEGQIGTNLVTGDAAAIDALLLDKGFSGSRFAAEMAAREIDVT